MLGVRYAKAPPTAHLMQFRRGRVVREGAGLSLFYFAPTSTLVLVPLASTDVPFVSTGAGSTGWLSSLLNMADGFDRWRRGATLNCPTLAWEDRRLVWAVREPFASKQSSAQLVVGFLEEGEELVIESLMPEEGIVFSDGVQADFLEFLSGTIATVTASQQRAQLVIK